MYRTRSISVFGVCIFLSATALFAVSFTHKNYLTGQSPQAVVSADINRDGHPDLIVADSTTSPDGANEGFVSVLLGNANGTFSIDSNLPTARTAVALVAGDFNNDGYPDVVVLEDGGFQLFISSENGTLIPQDFVALGGTTGSIVAVDLNGDHIPDLALTVFGLSSGNLKTFLNDRTGHFTAVQTISVSTGLPGALVAADFDLDGHDDLAVADGNAVRILHSNNNGTLTQRASLIVPGNIGAFGLAAGDVDAKNGSDLVFETGDACGPDCLFAATLHVYLNNGSGTLVPGQSIEMGGNSGNLNYLVDITGNNRLDIVHVRGAVQDSNGALSYARYVVNGTFSSFTTLAVMDNPQDLVARDFNLDSRHDLAVAQFGTLGAVPATVVFLNTNSATICLPPSSANLAAKFCAPSSQPGSETVTVLASGNSPTGVRRVELWVDGKKKYNAPDDQLQFKITLAHGTHKLELVAVDRFGSVAKTSRSVTVP